jgi:putative ABC transport system substrate-binding protein
VLRGEPVVERLDASPMTEKSSIGDETVDGLDGPRALSRRRLIGGIVAVGAAGAIGATAWRSPDPSPNAPFRVAFLFTRLTEVSVQSNIATAKAALRELGYVEGRHVTYGERDAGGQPTRFRAIAVELVADRPDLIICQNSEAALALKNATDQIPILFVNLNSDPVETGLVASLSHPGGTLTGLMMGSNQTWAKELQLFNEIVPSLKRIAWVRDQAQRGMQLPQLMESTARALDVALVPISIVTDGDLDGALQAVIATRSDGVMYHASLVTGGQLAPRVIAFAREHQLPLSMNNPEALMTYASQIVDPWKRAAPYIDRLLKGTAPADLPIEGPTVAMFRINLCRVSQLGLTLPAAVMAQATVFVQCPTY